MSQDVFNAIRRLQKDAFDAHCFYLETCEKIVCRLSPEPFDFMPIDWDRCFIGWLKWIQHSILCNLMDSLMRDFMESMARTFFGDIRIHPSATMLFRFNRPVIFFANHEIDVEGIFFSIIMRGMFHYPVEIMARRSVIEESYLSPVLQWIGKRIGLDERNPYLGFCLIDQKDPLAVWRAFTENVRQMKAKGISMLVHVEGEHAKMANHKVEKLSSSLIDLAIDADLPIVPVRFFGALPVTPVSVHFLQWPYRFGREHMDIGAPIDPADLSKMPSFQRKAHVLEQMNAVGPVKEEPSPPNLRFESMVQQSMETYGWSEEQAVIYVLLKQSRNPSMETKMILDAIEHKKPVRDPSLLELYRRIFG